MIDHTDPGHPPHGPRRGGPLSRASRAAKSDEDGDAPGADSPERRNHP